MDEKLKDVFNSIGAITELMFVFKMQCLSAGFNQYEAIELTKTFLTVALANSIKGGSTDDE